MLRKKLREARGFHECEPDEHIWLGQKKSLNGIRWLTVCLKCGKIKKD